MEVIDTPSPNDIQGEIKRLREENAALVAEKDKFKRLAVILHNQTEEYKNNVRFVLLKNNFFIVSKQSDRLSMEKNGRHCERYFFYDPHLKKIQHNFSSCNVNIEQPKVNFPKPPTTWKITKDCTSFPNKMYYK
jgi:allophanate hydrolase subunit 2